MTRLISVTFFCAFLVVEAFCNDDITIGDLPSDAGNQLKGILSSDTGHQLKAECKTRLRTNVELLLFNRNNQQEPVILNVTHPTQFDSSKKVVIVVHGWLSSPTTSGIVKLKDSYLKRYDCNLIVIDWSKAASLSYTSSFCHVAAVAQYVAKALCYLKQHGNLPLDKIHIVGHSFGAHIGGLVGKYITTKCKGKLGRITGLDPAGIVFNELPHNRKLDKSDAVFVDVIYTDGDRFGTTIRYGHANFYPNCGQHQPGCDSIRQALDDTLISDVFCSHHRSLEYMAESVLSNNFIATSCGMCPRYCRPQTINEEYTLMGEDSRPETRFIRNLYLPTKNSSPYFEGWDAYDGVSHRLV